MIFVMGSSELNVTIILNSIPLSTRN